MGIVAITSHRQMEITERFVEVAENISGIKLG